jgi:hypothetical protein
MLLALAPTQVHSYYRHDLRFSKAQYFFLVILKVLFLSKIAKKSNLKIAKGFGLLTFSLNFFVSLFKIPNCFAKENCNLAVFYLQAAFDENGQPYAEISSFVRTNISETEQ